MRASTDTALMSYAVKFASAYYGPFREAADSTPSSGDRQSYQMDFRNPREAVREALLDVEEGADWLMVKPALPYLDVIRAVREASRLPLSAYNVSGEYSAVKAAAANGWLDEARIVRENLLAIRRAGRRSDHHLSRARRAARESGCDDDARRAPPKARGSRATRGSSAPRRSRRAA